MSNLGLWLALGVILLGFFCFEGSLRVTGSSLVTKIVHISLKWTGLFSMSVALAYVCSKSMNPRFMDTKYMDILDWSICIFSVIFMPIFEALGLEPLMWILLVLFPCIVVYCVKKALKYRF